MARTKGRTSRLTRAFLNQERGATAVEFALVLPVLATILFAILQFGLTLNNFIQLTDSVRAGAREFAISRSSATPWSSARSMILNGAPSLTSANVTLTFSVAGTACGSDGACSTQLSALSPGISSATVKGAYPCDLKVVGVDFAPGCTLTAQTTELVE